jgi:hypothetical protein
MDNPPLFLADARFLLSCSDEIVCKEEKEKVKKEILEEIEKKGEFRQNLIVVCLFHC